MNPKISIIVPIFNVEPYLHKCIDSILQQTFTDFELILVDDGSPDNCGQICDEYAQIDSRIKVIHKQNGGLSSARNAGLEIAKGEYIGFVDSDDYINIHMYEVLLSNAISYSSDLILCDYHYINEDEIVDIKAQEKEVETKNYTNIQALEQLYRTKHGIYVLAWNKLYKRNLFQNLRYNQGRIYEDEFIIHKILYKCSKVTFVSNKLYYYVKRSGSILNSPYYIKKFDKVYALKDRADYFRKIKQKHLHYQAMKMYTDYFFWNYYVAKNELENVEKELKKLRNSFKKRGYFLLRNPLISLKQKIAIILFIINPFIYEALIKRKVTIQIN